MSERGWTSDRRLTGPDLDRPPRTAEWHSVHTPQGGSLSVLFGRCLSVVFTWMLIGVAEFAPYRYNGSFRNTTDQLKFIRSKFEDPAACVAEHYVFWTWA